MWEEEKKVCPDDMFLDAFYIRLFRVLVGEDALESHLKMPLGLLYVRPP